MSCEFRTLISVKIDLGRIGNAEKGSRREEVLNLLRWIVSILSVYQLWSSITRQDLPWQR